MPRIDKPQAGEDVRKLHRYVRELVSHTNALLNMRVALQGEMSGVGGLFVSGGASVVDIYTPSLADTGVSDKRPTSCVLTSSVNPADYGATIYWTGKVASDAKGSMQFYIDGAPFGNPVPVSAGTATSAPIVAGSQLAAGTHDIQVKFSGDAFYLPATANLKQGVNGLNKPIVTAFGNPNPADKMQNVFFGANVQGVNTIPPAPPITGYVRFFIDGSDYQDAPLSQQINSQTWRATVSAPYLSVGTHDIQAMYLGDSHYGTATDDYLQVIEDRATVLLTIDPNPTGPNTLVTFYVTVVPATAGSTRVPTGNVQLTLGGVAFLSPARLDANGKATFTVPGGFAEGLFEMGANYGGDGVYMSSSSSVVELKVQASAPFPPYFGTSPNAASFPLVGGTGFFTVTVTGYNQDPALPGATVQLYTGPVTFGFAAQASVMSPMGEQFNGAASMAIDGANIGGTTSYPGIGVTKQMTEGVLQMNISVSEPIVEPGSTGTVILTIWAHMATGATVQIGQDGFNAS